MTSGRDQGHGDEDATIFAPRCSLCAVRHGVHHVGNVHPMTFARWPAGDVVLVLGGRVERVSRGGPLFWSVGLGLVALAFWVSGGHTLFAGLGDARKSASGPQLAIENVKSRVEAHGERLVLFIEGDAVNRGASGLPVPPIAIAITEGTGQTMRHFLGTNGLHLVAGQSFGFSSRVEAPSNGVKNVMVTFRED
jgi:hypothetical protein